MSAMEQQKSRMSQSSASQGSQSINRAMTLLRAVSRQNETGVRLTRLAQDVGLHVATVRRILHALTEEGMLTYDPLTKLYHLGFELHLLGSNAHQYTLRYRLRLALEKIAEETQDCVFLLVRSGYDVLCIDMVQGAYPIQTMPIEINSRRPLGMGAGSQAILALSPEKDIEKILAANAPLYPQYRGITVDDIRALAEETKKRGFGVNNEFFYEGVVSIGVPIRSRGDNILGAISISAISSRMTDARQEEILAIVHNHIAPIVETL